MLKLIKWESIDIAKRYSPYYIVFLIVLLVALGFPVSYEHKDIVAMSCSIVGGMLFGLAVIFQIEIVYNWLDRKNGILENSIPIKSWKILLSKIICLVLIQIINCALISILSFALVKFSTENTSYLNLSFNNPIFAIITYVFLVNAIVLSDFIARSIEKKKHIFVAIMIFIVMMLVMLYIYAFVLKITGSAEVDFYGLSFSIKNESNPFIRYIFYSVFAIGFFITSNKLLERKIDV